MDGPMSAIQRYGQDCMCMRDTRLLIGVFGVLDASGRLNMTAGSVEEISV